MQLVLDTPRIVLSKKGQLFHIKSEKGHRTISPGKLTSIAITADVILHATAVVLSIKHQIPILFFNRIGKIQARLWSPYFQSIATLRRMQLRFTESTEASSWIVDLMLLKTDGQVDNLDYLAKRKYGIFSLLSQTSKQLKQQKRLFEQYRNQLPEVCRRSIMGTEGTIARIYWQTIGGALPRAYTFHKRSRRPAEDHFNAAINYAYGMLYGIVETGLFAAGLDPHLGILHADAYKKPTLAFDVIEPFRPWIDRLIIEACVDNELKHSFFTKNQHGLFLNKAGKAFLIPLFNNYLRSERKWLGRESSVKNHIFFLAGRLAQRIRAVEG